MRGAAKETERDGQIVDDTPPERSESESGMGLVQRLSGVGKESRLESREISIDETREEFRAGAVHLGSGLGAFQSSLATNSIQG